MEVLRRSAGRGAPLPDSTRIRMSEAFGHDLTSVRIHDDSESHQVANAVQSVAFTHGRDIYFSRGTYNPSTSSGQRLLAHELSHAVTPERPTGGQTVIGHADDPAEAAAEATAGRVTAQLRRSYRAPSVAAEPTPGRVGADGGTPLRRLMSGDEFKQQTPGKYRSRSGVAKIDKELVKFEAIKIAGTADTAAKTIQRRDSLHRLQDLCKNYDGKRGAGVDQLAKQLSDELAVTEPFAKAAVELDNKKPIPSVDKGLEVAHHIFEGQDMYIDLEQRGRVDDKCNVFSGMFGTFQTALGDHRAEVMQRLVLEDLEELQKAAGDDGTDPLVAAMLKEVLRNKGNVEYAETGGMASNARIITDRDKKYKDSDKKYLLETQLAQTGGSVERQSTVMHELIHISVQEKFQNTAVHLAFDKDMKIGDVKALSDRRTQQINDLDGLKESLNGVLGPSQYQMFTSDSGKILYCVKGKNTLKSYAEAMSKTNRITPQEKDFILNLEAAGCNNTLSEFDTSISQMAFVLDRWGVPKDNAFRAKLDEIAKEAYEYRGSLGGNV